MRKRKGIPVRDCTLPYILARRWSENAATIDIPELDGDPRRHARSICDELDDRSFEDDPYVAALAAGALLARSSLPEEILENLYRFKEGELPFLVVHNIPTGHVSWNQVHPPRDGVRPRWKPDWTSEMALLGTVQAAGFESFAYFEEADGSLVHDLVPAHGWECAYGEPDRQCVAFHTDNAAHPRAYRAEGVALLGLVNDGVVRTVLASLDDVLEELTPEHIDALSRELYAMTPATFDDGRPFANPRPRPILYRGPGGRMEIRGAVHAMQPCCGVSDQQLALDALRALVTALAPVAREVVLGPGDLLLMSNVTAMHALHAKQGPRWLQRVYFRGSLDRLRDNSLTADRRLTRRFHMQPAMATAPF